MQRLILTAMVLVCVSVLPVKAVAQVQQIEIVSYGIYKYQLQSATRDLNGILQSTAVNFTLEAQTTTVPIKKGINFGFEYKVIGSPSGATVALREITVYPPSGVRPSSASHPLYSDEYGRNRAIGEVGHIGYVLDDPWEMVPGEWHLQIWGGDQKLADKTFTLVATSAGRSWTASAAPAPRVVQRALGVN